MSVDEDQLKLDNQGVNLRSQADKGDYKVLTQERDLCRFVEGDFLYLIVYVLSNSIVYH